MKKEYYVRFARKWDDEDSLVVLPAFWKLLWWLFREGRRCERIVIFTLKEESNDER